MAAHVARAGFPLSVCTRTPGKAERWAEGVPGAQALPLARLAADSDVVVMCVTDSPDVEALADPILHNARPDTIVVDMSTISPSRTVQLRYCCQWPFVVAAGKGMTFFFLAFFLSLFSQ